MRRRDRLPPGERPLAGVRVLDLTRVIAGPVCGRVLAAHGADVLLVTAAHLPQMGSLVIDSGRGKRSTFIDLRQPSGRDAFAGSCAARIFSFRAIVRARCRPGVSARSRRRERAPASSTYRSAPTATRARGRPRRGFDSLVQNANGINDAEATAAGASQAKASTLPGARSRHRLPHGVWRDDGAGPGEQPRAEAGTCGSRWPRPANGFAASGGCQTALHARTPASMDVHDRLEECDFGFGRLTAVRHAAVMAETPPRWDRPAVPLGAHAPAWTPARTALKLRGELHVFEVARLVVDADARRRDPAREFAGLAHRLHQTRR